MGIRLKIALSFALLIVVLTSVIVYWGAQTIGISLEAVDLDKLEAIREQTLVSWKLQHRSLSAIARHVAASLEQPGAVVDSSVETLELVERLRRHLNLDWVEIVRDGTPVLYPAVTPSIPEGDEIFWPVRLSSAGPLSYSGYIVSSIKISGSGETLIVARVPADNLSDSAFTLWDDRGILAGEFGSFSISDLNKLEEPGVTRQMVVQGRLLRLRTLPVFPGGPNLMVGLEADSATLTRTGVNELMIQVAVLEVAGLLILGSLLGRWLFRPLEMLRQGIERVAQGHWNEIPEIDAMGSSGDEIRTVAESFNGMVRQLRVAQGKLIEIQKELARRDKMAAIGRFSAGVAHEINNPLGTILVSAGILKDALSESRPVELEDIDAIIDETKRCRHIVSSLLQYAHNRAPVLNPVPVPELFEMIEKKLSTILKHSKIRLELNPPPQAAVLVDPIGFAQVVRNLFDNASDALSCVSDPVVGVEAAVSDDYVRFCVSDNGSGVGDSYDIIFEPLMTTKEQGTGLGLAICQAIVEGHGGRIWVERDSGLTKFGFTLKKVAETPSGAV